MFKKNVWLVGLLAALAILFVGCLDPLVEEDTSNMEEFVVVDLARAIAGKSGPINTEAGATGFEQISGDKPDYFNPAGGIPSQVVFNITSAGLEVTPVANWGAGLDLTDKNIKFKTGDKIYIKGVATEGGTFLLSAKADGWKPLDGWDGNLAAGTAFEKTFTLTAADLGDIKSGNPQAIRVRRENYGKFLISELKVTGLREKGFIVGPGGYSSSGPTPICKCSDPNCPCKANPKKDCGTEIFGSDVFECEFCRPEDASSFTPGTGTYTAPTSTDPNVFYVDLGSLNAGDGGKIINIEQAYATDKNVKIETSKVTYYFEANNQPLAINLTSATKTAVLGALKAGLYVDVEINAKASPRMGMRFGFADPTTGSSWNSVNLAGPVLFSDNTTTVIKARLTPNAGNISTAAPKTADTFLIQLREARKSALEINSIKITIPSGIPVTVSELPADVAPNVGKARKTTFETTQFTGAIDWKVSGSAATGTIFEPQKRYTADITLTAKTHFTFAGGPSVFTFGGISSQVISYASDGTKKNGKVTLEYTFPSTIDASVFNGTVKAQAGSTLADITTTTVGTTVTATYTPGTGDPAEANVTFTWQKETATDVWTNVATGKTWTTNDIGAKYRVTVSANNYLDGESATTFEITSVAATGSKDATLNATYTREGTKFWSFADWVGTNTDWTYGSSPLAISNGGGTVTVTKVGTGINVTNRNKDGSCPVILTNDERYSNKGFTAADYPGGPWTPATKKYRITVLGFVIDTIPANGVQMKFQGDGGGGGGATGGGYGAVGTPVTVSASDGSFKLVFDVPADFNSTSNIRICNDSKVSSSPDVFANFRITLIEVEDLGDR